MKLTASNLVQLCSLIIVCFAIASLKVESKQVHDEEKGSVIKDYLKETKHSGIEKRAAHDKDSTGPKQAGDKDPQGKSAYNEDAQGGSDHTSTEKPHAKEGSGKHKKRRNSKSASTTTQKPKEYEAKEEEEGQAASSTAAPGEKAPAKKEYQSEGDEKVDVKEYWRHQEELSLKHAIAGINGWARAMKHQRWSSAPGALGHTLYVILNNVFKNMTRSQIKTLVLAYIDILLSEEHEKAKKEEEEFTRRPVKIDLPRRRPSRPGGGQMF